MRIHTDRLTSNDIYTAARTARAQVEVTRHGSRSRDHAFNVLLTGESRRRPNSGSQGAGDEYAATWDQWGVFLAILFDKDGSMTCPYYADAAEFHARTADRFRGRCVVGEARTFIDIPQGETVDYWPADAHGDHTFRYEGTPCEQSCTKCSAVQRWGR